MGIAVFPAASGGVTQKVQEFTSTGTFTAPSNCSAVRVFLVGGGGGGGGIFWTGSASAMSGGGGGGGGIVYWRTISVTPGTAYTVTIGAGGSGATGSAPGANGSNTSFGSLAIAYGGGGGGTQDSGGNATNTGVGATLGGRGASQSQGASGSGAAATYAPQTGNTTPYASIFAQNYATPISGSSLLSWGGNNATSPSYPGLGIEGFGGGGWGGNDNYASNTAFALSVCGGAVGSYQTTGANATANKGGGGGGTSRGSNTVTYNGGSGGSGYALIEYWS